MSINYCTVSGILQRFNGDVIPDEKIIIKRVGTSGGVISSNHTIYRSDANGEFSFDLPQGATANIFANAVGLDKFKQGTPVAIPAQASVELSTIIDPSIGFPTVIPLMTTFTPEKYTLTSAFVSHTGDATIHFTESSLNLNQYALSSTLDSHTSDSTIHFTKSSIDLDDLGDISITSPVDDDVLKYDSVSGWINGVGGGNAGLTGVANQIAVFSGTSSATGYADITTDGTNLLVNGNVSGNEIHTTAIQHPDNVGSNDAKLVFTSRVTPTWHSNMRSYFNSHSVNSGHYIFNASKGTGRPYLIWDDYQVGFRNATDWHANTDILNGNAWAVNGNMSVSGDITATGDVNAPTGSLYLQNSGFVQFGGSTSKIDVDEWHTNGGSGQIFNSKYAGWFWDNESYGTRMSLTDTGDLSVSGSTTSNQAFVSSTAITNANQLTTKQYVDDNMKDTIKYIKDIGSATGDIHLTDSTWAISFANIKYIRFDTSSTAYNVYLLQNDNGYATDDAIIPSLSIATNAYQNSVFYLDHPYFDEDLTDEVHLYWESQDTGSLTADIYVIGTEAK